VNELRASAVAMGERCRHALRLALDAFRTGAPDLVREVQGLDGRVNQDEKAIDALVLRILALRQPVASDLRLLMTTLRLVTDLERIGDEAVNIAERAEQGPCIAHGNVYADLELMSEEAQRMVSTALEAFVASDEARAREVLLRDDIVDELYGRTLRGMAEYMRTHPTEVPAAMCVISVSKYLERVADHATNIAEEVIFMIGGEDVRHQKSVPH
jgi:phosphate transport system protein